MSIVEIINMYDHSDIIRLEHWKDGKSVVVQSHTMRYVDYRTMIKHVDGMDAGMEQVRKSYETKKVYDGLF